MRRNELTNSAVDNNADVNNTATPTLTEEQVYRHRDEDCILQGFLQAWYNHCRPVGAVARNAAEHSDFTDR